MLATSRSASSRSGALARSTAASAEVTPGAAAPGTGPVP